MTTRREFLQTSSSALAMLGTPALLLGSRATADIIIRNGTVYDGLGGNPVQCDVVISNGRVVGLPKRSADRGTIEIDAKGLAVAPGFVDIHSHGDGSLWEDPRAESLVRQGITTIVVGQDGSSRAPRDPSDDDPEDSRQFANFAELWKSVDALTPAVNVASMIGLGTVRASVIGGDNRPATPAELARMVVLVGEALAAGACGASTGLEYTPGAFASREELIALCKPLRQYGRVYATHMRNEADTLLEAIDESIAIAKGAGCGLQISHLKTEGPRNWRKLNDVFARVERERKAGTDIAFDRYPYTAYQTGLTALFPVWSRDGSTQAFLARLDDPASAERIRKDTLDKIELLGGWDN